MKVLVQVISSCFMGVFLLPTTLGEEIELMLNSLCWKTKKMVVITLRLRQDRATNKYHGGLNLWDFEGFYLVMLRLTRVETRSSQSLHLSSLEFLEINIFQEAAFWRTTSICYTQTSIWSIVSPLSFRYTWEIGEGNGIRSDPWIWLTQYMQPTAPSVLCVMGVLMISCTLSLNALVLLIVRRNCICGL